MRAALSQPSSAYRARLRAENKQWSTTGKAPWLLRATANSWQTTKKAQMSDSGLPRPKGETGRHQTVPGRRKPMVPGEEGRETQLGEALAER